MTDISAILLSAVIEALMEKAVNTGWDVISKNVDIGSLSLNKEGQFDTIKGILGLLGGNDTVQVKLLEARNNQRNQFYTLYANEPSKLTIGNDIRVAYANQLWLMPQLQVGVDPNRPVAQLGSSYNVDLALNAPGYQEAAMQYRARIDPKKSDPLREPQCVCQPGMAAKPLF
jgi:hypothetical protein